MAINKNSNTRLPGIKKIYRVKHVALPEYVVERAVAKLRIFLTGTDRKGGNYTSVPFTGMPLVDVKQNWVNNSMVEQVTLTFRSLYEADVDTSTAWLIEDVNGDHWLIGAKEPLYPATAVSLTTGEPGGNPAVYSYEVKWTAKKALLPVVASIET